MEKFYNVVDTLVKKPEPKPRRTIKQVLIDFYYLSTAHGISHAASAPNRKIRLFWIVVFSFCLVILIFQLWMIIDKYLQFQVIVKVDVRKVFYYIRPKINYLDLKNNYLVQNNKKFNKKNIFKKC